MRRLLEDNVADVASTGRSISSYRFIQLCEFFFARKHYDKKSIVSVSELEFAWSTNDGISVWTTLSCLDKFYKYLLERLELSGLYYNFCLGGSFFSTAS